MPDFDVTELPTADPPATGEEAPDFTRPLVNDEFWADLSLDELTDEGPVCLVFHPMAGSFPTTYIWQEIAERDWGERLRVVGLTVSDPYALKALIRERGLEDTDYAVFSDPTNAVAERFGVAHDLDGMSGIAEPRPAVFIVDADRTVRSSWVASSWPEFPDYDAVDAAIDELAVPA